MCRGQSQFASFSSRYRFRRHEITKVCLAYETVLVTIKLHHQVRYKRAATSPPMTDISRKYSSEAQVAVLFIYIQHFIHFFLIVDKCDFDYTWVFRLVCDLSDL